MLAMANTGLCARRAWVPGSAWLGKHAPASHQMPLVQYRWPKNTGAELYSWLVLRTCCGSLPSTYLLFPCSSPRPIRL